ncbi:MAG TPA: putative quinol monooxygenase [Solirubrobacteraceae bacterium]|nr:putative quinol monooxygenase [Solirubrobacteraceae bacterium]
MIVVTGRMRIEPEHRERYAEVTTEMCRRSREEQGCEGYRVYGELEQEGRYVIVEEWADEEALQRHFGEPHTREFLTALFPLLAEPADALFHTVASTRRLDPQRGLIALD